MAEPATGFSGKLSPSSRTDNMAASASGNSRMTLSTACAGGPSGYFGWPGVPMNCARIASMNSLRTNPSAVISVGSVATESEIGADVDPPDAGYSDLPNMGVLSPSYGFGFYIRGSWP